MPKTGGTYIEDLFKCNGYTSDFLDPWPWKHALLCSPQHYPKELYEQLIDLEGFQGRSFMTVRNPLDRLISEFRHQIDMNRKPLNWVQQSLEDWLVRIDQELDENRNIYDNHLNPQINFFHPSLTIFKQEDRFDYSWAKQLNSSFQLGFKNYQVKVRRNSVKSQLKLTKTQRDLSVDFCQKHYSEDFKFYNYTVENSELLSR